MSPAGWGQAVESPMSTAGRTPATQPVWTGALSVLTNLGKCVFRGEMIECVSEVPIERV